MTARKPFPRWPLALIASPAFVAIWSGWVSLGQLCGFGDVQPLPGLVRWHIDTALTLPLGIESYAALALGAWLTGAAASDRARRFAFWSALGALALGALGQVSYHLLAAHHAKSAPDIVIVLVSVLPVAVLGQSVALMHMLHAPAKSATGDKAERPSRTQNTTARKSAPGRKGAPVTALDTESAFMDQLASGAVPSIRQIRARMHVGQDRGKELRAHLETVTRKQ